MAWQEHSSDPLENMVCSVTIVSDSLFQMQELNKDSEEKDKSGPVALEKMVDYGIMKTNIDYLPDEESALKAKIESEITLKTDLIILIGGTGLAKRDVTFEAISSVIEKEIPGFGEEFRRQSYQHVGPFGLMSRAVAGIKKKSIIVGIPGSPKATELAMDILLPMVGHVSQLLRK